MPAFYLSLPLPARANYKQTEGNMT